MSDFWTFLEKLTDLYTTAVAVSALNNKFQQYAESPTLEALELQLEAKLKKTERLCEDLTKDPIVRTVINQRNPCFFKVFSQELAKIRRLQHSATLEKKRLDKKANISKTDIEDLRDRLNAIIELANETYIDKLSKSESLEPDDVLYARIMECVPRLPVDAAELWEITERVIMLYPEDVANTAVHDSPNELDADPSSESDAETRQHGIEEYDIGLAHLSHESLDQNQPHEPSWDHDMEAGRYALEH